MVGSMPGKLVAEAMGMGAGVVGKIRHSAPPALVSIPALGGLAKPSPLGAPSIPTHDLLTHDLLTNDVDDHEDASELQALDSISNAAPSLIPDGVYDSDLDSDWDEDSDEDQDGNKDPDGNKDEDGKKHGKKAGPGAGHKAMFSAMRSLSVKIVLVSRGEMDGLITEREGRAVVV